MKKVATKLLAVILSCLMAFSCMTVGLAAFDAPVIDSPQLVNSTTANNATDLLEGMFKNPIAFAFLPIAFPGMMAVGLGLVLVLVGAWDAAGELFAIGEKLLEPMMKIDAFLEEKGLA